MASGGQDHPQKQIAASHIKAAAAYKKPSRPLNAYNFFFRDERKKLLQEAKEHGTSKIESELSNGGSSAPRDPDGTINLFGALGTLIGMRWKRLPAQDREKYKTMASDAKERHRREMEEYNQRLINESPLYRASQQGKIGLKKPAARLLQQTSERNVETDLPGGRSGIINEGLHHRNSMSAASRQTEFVVAPTGDQAVLASTSIATQQQQPAAGHLNLHGLRYPHSHLTQIPTYPAALAPVVPLNSIEQALQQQQLADIAMQQERNVEVAHLALSEELRTRALLALSYRQIGGQLSNHTTTGQQLTIPYPAVPGVQQPGVAALEPGEPSSEQLVESLRLLDEAGRIVNSLRNQSKPK